MASQNIYDDEKFFNNYAQLPRSKNGFDSFFEWPYLKKLLPNMNGINALDLGCGYGWFCRESFKLGVDSILGIDLSNKMITKAKELDNDFGNKEGLLYNEKIKYEIQDLESLQLKKESYDLAFSIFVFHYIVDLESMLKQVHQSLKPGGTLLFTIEHPIYSCPKVYTDFIDLNEKKTWPVSDYSIEGERVSNWMAEGVIKQHRTMGTYINQLINCGFSIDHVNEWAPSKDQIEQFDFLKIEIERPMILIIKASKK
ncbi:hypothetical protein DICPUDRAFT_74044 [Dictyostelium purpureum]|uniref:Methyltransferase type 11 domain-containing protein n=1 Tax=Dictyostelium purpureum TaxID=5786 RepID=F0Z6L6_DICPU|nr:uncharacterized protein DICPUDRAFT_74044 [Dictyostelium purpureum]EGC40457.1 hypothetical protein DICPUDRAFT_74044 [Dictyostelium purpureum]|eukprot:XP_003283004.1 hypothetical protein DICPUDRAFT_74044 [Dictyostelium purpureum]